jgi:hypothetical protein
MWKSLVAVLALVGLTAYGCRSNTTDNPQNDATANPHDGSVQGDTGSTGDSPSGQHTYDKVKDLRDSPPAADTPVTINSAIVTGQSGNRRTVWIQDSPGGPRTGIAIYCDWRTTATSPCAVDATTFKGLTVGKQVKVSGKLINFNGLVEIYPSAIDVLGTGTVPDPVDVAVADLKEDNVASDYRGVLVNISGVSAGAPLFVTSTTPAPFVNSNANPSDCNNGPSYSAFEACTNESCSNPASDPIVAVETTFYYNLGIASSANCAYTADGGTSTKLVVVGDKFSKLQGIVDVDPFASNQTGLLIIAPRSTDYTYVASGDHDGGM